MKPATAAMEAGASVLRPDILVMEADKSAPLASSFVLLTSIFFLLANMSFMEAYIVVLLADIFFMEASMFFLLASIFFLQPGYATLPPPPHATEGPRTTPLADKNVAPEPRAAFPPSSPPGPGCRRARTARHPPPTSPDREGGRSPRPPSTARTPAARSESPDTEIAEDAERGGGLVRA